MQPLQQPCGKIPFDSCVRCCRFSWVGLPVPAALWLETPGNMNMTGNTSGLGSRLSLKPIKLSRGYSPIVKCFGGISVFKLFSICVFVKCVKEERGSHEEQVEKRWVRGMKLEAKGRGWGLQNCWEGICGLTIKPCERVHTARTLLYTLHVHCCSLQCIHFLSLPPFSPVNAAQDLAEVWLFALWLILDLF